MHFSNKVDIKIILDYLWLVEANYIKVKQT